MSRYFVRLQSDWLLRGWLDMPMAAVNHKNGKVKKLDKRQFYILQSCDGKTNFNSFAFLPTHLEILKQFIHDGIAHECIENDEIEPFQYYRYSNTPFIKTVQWCVTGHCNLNCLHCFMESPSGKYGELSFEAMTKLIEQFEEANVVSVVLTGGEPFLRRDIIDLISLLRKKRIHIEHILTNGLLVTDKHLSKLKELGISPSFQISFDGVGSHDYMRGTKGIEQNVIKSIERIQKAGFHVVVSTSIDKKSVDSLGFTYELMKQIGVRSWRISIPQETGNWKDTKTALSLDELSQKLHAIWMRWDNDERPFSIQLGGFFSSGAKNNNKDKISIKKAKFTPDSIDCQTCKEQSYLLPDGILLPCAGYVDTILEKTMPSLLEKRLINVWRDSNLHDIANLTKQDILNKNQECAKCDLFGECGSGCRASALVETGDIMGKDPITCAIWKNGHRHQFEESKNK